MPAKVCYKNRKAPKGREIMNAKRIICLILAAVMLLGLLASAITILVSAEEATAPTQPTEPVTEPENTVNADMIIFAILGIGVPVVIFALILIKVNKGR